MGTDTIPDRTNGQTIVQSFFNLLKSVLKGDLVPRNTNGIATTDAGSLGSSTYKWLNQYLSSSGKIYIGTAEIYLSGNEIMCKDQSGTAFSLSGIIEDLIGVSAGDSDLGMFTGSTISDSNDIKGALQELETEIESVSVDADLKNNVHVKYQAAEVSSSNNSYGNVFSGGISNAYINATSCFVECSFEAYGTSDGIGGAYSKLDLRAYVGGTILQLANNLAVTNDAYSGDRTELRGTISGLTRGDNTIVLEFRDDSGTGAVYMKNVKLTISALTI